MFSQFLSPPVLHLSAKADRPLYVQRKLTPDSAEKFVAWAKGQGFDKVLAPEELHVTIVFSKSPVNWQSLEPDDTPLQVVGGHRRVKPLGDKGAVVMTFSSQRLQARWSAWRAAGASWDYPDYHPHVTITYKHGLDDLRGIEPYTGTLEFGPEVFQPIDDDYAAEVVEKFAGILKFDPNQPRHPAGGPKGGQFASTGGADYSDLELDDHGDVVLPKDFYDRDHLVRYHGTSSEALEAIRTYGLVPEGSEGADAWAASKGGLMGLAILFSAGKRKASVYVTPDPQVAKWYARKVEEVHPGSKAIVLKLKIPKTETLYPDPMDDRAETTPNRIPPEWIEEVTDVYDRVIKSERVLYLVLVADQHGQMSKALKFNAHHEPGGSPKGGQFAEAVHKGLQYVKGLGWAGSSGQGLPTALQARLEALRVPKVWREVELAHSEHALLQASGLDSKNRRQPLYSAEHKHQSTAEKYARLERFNQDLPALRTKIHDRLTAEPTDQLAVLRIIESTGLRPGSDKETYAKVKSFGVTTLLGEHVQTDGPVVSLTFPGKAGVINTRTVVDPVLADYLRSKNLQPGQRVFSTSDRSVRRALTGLTDGQDYEVKDFRTWHGTNEALKALSGLPVPQTAKEAAKVRREVAKAVSGFLGNTPAVALESYISPVVFEHHSLGLLPVKKSDSTLMDWLFRQPLLWSAKVSPAGPDPDPEDLHSSAKFEQALKFNPYHHPAGSARGGQFAKSPGVLALDANADVPVTLPGLPDLSQEQQLALESRLTAEHPGVRVSNKPTREFYLRVDPDNPTGEPKQVPAGQPLPPRVWQGVVQAALDELSYLKTRGLDTGALDFTLVNQLPSGPGSDGETFFHGPVVEVRLGPKALDAERSADLLAKEDKHKKIWSVASHQLVRNPEDSHGYMRAIFRHELGHVLSSMPVYMHVATHHARQVGFTPKGLKNKVSVYGSTSPAEGLAEMFAKYYDPAYTKGLSAGHEKVAKLMLSLPGTSSMLRALQPRNNMLPPEGEWDDYGGHLDWETARPFAGLEPEPRPSSFSRALKYDPKQPREPKGKSTGGRFAKALSGQTEPVQGELFKIKPEHRTQASAVVRALEVQYRENKLLDKLRSFDQHDVYLHDQALKALEPGDDPPEMPETFKSLYDRAQANMTKLMAGAHMEVRRKGLRSLESTLVDGRMKTQFETHTSSGLLDTDVRDRAESAMFDRDEGGWEDQERPVYGLIQGDPPDLSVGVHYGRIIVALKPETNRRVTFTADDSLDTSYDSVRSMNVSAIIPSALENPSMASFFTFDELAVGSRYGTAQTMRERLSKMAKATSIQSAMSGLRIGSYVEAQIHGQLRATDIKHIVVPRNMLPDMSRDALVTAKRLGIKIIPTDPDGSYTPKAVGISDDELMRELTGV